MLHSDLLARFNARLLAGDSATAILEEWCGGRITVKHLPSPHTPLSPEQKSRLRVEGDGEIVHRRVALICGKNRLSEADNWYRPDCLTPAMRDALHDTDLPFGTIVAPLAPTRETFYAAPLHEPPFLLEHRAVLSIAGDPLCEVRERYTEAILHVRVERGSP